MGQDSEDFGNITAKQKNASTLRPYNQGKWMVKGTGLHWIRGSVWILKGCWPQRAALLRLHPPQWTCTAMSERSYTPSLVVWTVQLRWRMFNCDTGDIWVFKKLFICLFDCARSWFWHAGSFSCSMQTLSCGMWNLVPWLEIELGPPALGVWSLRTSNTCLNWDCCVNCPSLWFFSSV